MKNSKKTKAKTGIPEIYYQLLPLVLTAIFFAPVLGFDILNWDDQGYILENPLLRDFSFYKLFSLYWMGNYHPLTMLLFTVGSKVFGFNGLLFHLVNLCFHLFNVFLVYRLSEKLVPGNLFVAVLTSVLFGIHPMHIESVTWISELKDVLYATFFLLSLNIYIRYIKEGRKIFYGLSLFFFLLSLLSKGQAVVLTPVIILVDIFWKRRYTPAVIAEKIPFLVFSIGFGLLALKAQQSVSALSYGMVDANRNYLFGFYNYVFYLLKILYPDVLSGVHPYSPVSQGHLYTFTAGFFLLLAAGIWGSVKTGSRTFFGLAFFVITISIVVKFIPVGEALLAERYTYIPYIGPFLLLSLFFSWLLQKPKYKAAGIALLSVYLVSLLVSGYFYLNTYKNSETYWLNTIREYPLYGRAHYALALHYTSINQPGKAIEQNSEAIRLAASGDRKDLANLYVNRASIYINKLSDYSNALNDYRMLLELDSLNKDVSFNMGYCFANLNRNEEAVSSLKRQLRHDPGNALSYYFLSVCNTRLNNAGEAYEEAKIAIRLQPDMYEAYLQRAVICCDYLQKQEDAVKDLLFLESKGYNLQNVYLYMAISYLHLGQYAKVTTCGEKVIRLGGDKGKALYIEALACDKLHQFSKAYAIAREAQTVGYPVNELLMKRWRTAGGS
ncbi:MAG: tetratricopeptide repeat protein [Bacteroidota bacterium]